MLLCWLMIPLHSSKYPYYLATLFTLFTEFLCQAGVPLNPLRFLLEEVKVLYLTLQVLLDFLDDFSTKHKLETHSETHSPETHSNLTRLGKFEY